jgi:hypothetical protein
MPARSTAYYLLLKHTSQTVDSYCSFLDIHLLRTPPCYVQLALHLVEGRRATIKALPTSPPHPRPYGKGIAPARMQSPRFGEGAWACRRTLPSVLKKSFK